MNKKGFTLIELLGSIVILSILVLITSKAITGILKSGKVDIYDSQIELIESAAKLYVDSNDIVLPNATSSNPTIIRYILLSDLKESDLLDEEIINPKNNKEFTDDDLIIKITISYDDKYKRSNVNYEVITDKEEITNIKNNYVHILYKETFYTVTYYGIVKDDTFPTKVLDGNTLKVDFSDKKEYMSVKVTMSGKEIDAYTYQNGILTIPNVSGNIVIKKALEEPNLSIGLTPVRYNGTNWVVADTKSEWYNYEKQEWANAVLLKDGVSKNIGDTVNIEGNTADIIGIFVWIPRFEYKIEGTYGKGGTSLELPGEIEINFLSKTSNGSKEGYRLHPGFTFGNTQLSGLWLGKFETTGTSTSPTVLANTSSLRSQNVSSQFTTSQLLTSKLTNGDSHMTKASEWMTASYLSQSKYGKYGNSLYTGSNKEVYQNKSSSFITGSSNGTPSQDTTNTQCKYNTLTDRGSGTGYCGGGASTTGNIYGIYDMSGGSNEFQMSNYNKTSGKSTTYNSGFNGSLYEGGSITNGKSFPDSKYYDLYTTEDKTTACNGPCYGLTETRGWYGDYDYFVAINIPWLVFGSDYLDGITSGVFFVSSSGGSSSNGHSFRIALTS